MIHAWKFMKREREDSPYRVAVQLLHRFPLGVHEVIDGEAALRVVRARVIGHNAARQSQGTANGRQHAREHPTLPVLDRFPSLVVLLEYLLRAEPLGGRRATPEIVGPVAHHRPVVVRRVHLSTKPARSSISSRGREGAYSRPRTRRAL